MKTLYLCGAGNSEGVRLALTVNNRSPRWDRIYLLDDDPAKHGKSILGIEIIGSFSTLETVDRSSSEVVNMVARGTAKRLSAYKKIVSFGLPFASLVHPDVDTSGVELAPDVIVYQNAVLGPESAIEEGSVVFMGSIVGHESRVGKHCVIAPNAILNARVVLGDGVYVGSNATILPEISIGAEATIGVGSAVVQNVPSGATVMGVPAETVCLKPSGGKDPVVKTDKKELLGFNADESLSRLQDSASERFRLTNGNQEHSSRRPFEDMLFQQSENSDGFVTPRNETEKVLLSIWQKTFKNERIGINDNFFDIGGSSLQAMEILSAVKATFGYEPSLADFFRRPTISDLSKSILRLHIDQADEEQVDAALTFMEKLSDEEVDRLLNNF